MNYRILTTPRFKKEVKKLSKKFKKIKDDILILVHEIQKNPKSGVSLGNGAYKVRVSNSSIPTGKSGGFRVITYFLDGDDIYFLTIYSKTEKENISDNELSEILGEIE
jgi:mRNA-degrading endonuclease RelE of RelBE toxin-antitoxin system